MTYIPDRGHVIWLDFQPQTGKEQSKRRPALVLSPQAYNQYGLAIVVPITTGHGIIGNKGFKVTIPQGLKVSGTIVSDQIKSLDWQARNAKKITELSQRITDDVIARMQTLLL